MPNLAKDPNCINPINSDDVLLVADEVATILRIAKSTVYTLTQRGTLPAVRIGGAVRFSRSAIQDFVKAQSRKLVAA